MRMARVVVLLTLLAASAVGCASAVPPEVLQAWVGRPAVALEKDWGPATREVLDGDLRILIYEEVTKQSSRSFESNRSVRSLGTFAVAQAAAQEAYRLPTVYVRSYLFWVDRDGTIVHSAVHQP